jgi:CRP-like cAMP-binding protein
MERRSAANHLETHEAFLGAPPRALKRLAARSRALRLKPGDLLARQGEPVREAAVLLEGLLASTVGLRSGSTSTVELIKAGEIWGCLTYLTGGVSPFDVRALEPSRVLLFPVADLLALVDVHPPAARAILRCAARRFRRLVALRALSGERSGRKICGVLLWLHDAAGPSVPLTQAMIATMAGQAQETVSRVLSHFKKSGWISYTRGRITIVRPDLLRGFLEAQ